MTLVSGLHEPADRGFIHQDCEDGKNTWSGDQIGTQLSARCLESISLEAATAEKNKAEMQQKLLWRCNAVSCPHLDASKAKRRQRQNLGAHAH